MYEVNLCSFRYTKTFNTMVSPPPPGVRRAVTAPRGETWYYRNMTAAAPPPLCILSFLQSTFKNDRRTLDGVALGAAVDCTGFNLHSPTEQPCPSVLGRGRRPAGVRCPATASRPTSAVFVPFCFAANDTTIAVAVRKCYAGLGPWSSSLY
ncbi:hypothetical protein J6590_001611 [Homalodisca vitripennis]|nr:hypothetical protein J6590_001611 [Homalodisca vitripennis]